MSHDPDSDALVRVPNAEANAAATDFPDGIVSVYTHDGQEWVPIRLDRGEATTVRLPNGQPAAYIQVDPEPEDGETDEE